MPTDDGVLRLFRFRPRRTEFDGFLRNRMVPDLRQMAGLIDVHVGRRGPDQGDDRIVVSAWTDRAAMAVGVGETMSPPIFHPERLDDTVDRDLAILESRIVLRFDRPERPTLLRVFHGEVHPGELDPYVEEVRAGTLVDAAAAGGPCALYLAIDPPDRFVTVSLWPSWQAIETATGGDVHRPMTTKDTRRLATMDVAHYEVVAEGP